MPLPRTPEFLLTTGSHSQAKLSYVWFHGSDKGFETFKKEILVKDGDNAVPTESHMSFVHLIKKPLARKPFLISLGLFGFQQLCGLTFLYYHMEEIFISVHANLDPGTSAALVGLVQVICPYVSNYVLSAMHKAGAFTSYSNPYPFSLPLIGNRQSQLWFQP